MDDEIAGLGWEGLAEARHGKVRAISVRNIEGAWRVGIAGGLVVNEDGGSAIGYNPGAVDPTAGEADFLDVRRKG